MVRRKTQDMKIRNIEKLFPVQVASDDSFSICSTTWTLFMVPFLMILRLAKWLLSCFLYLAYPFIYIGSVLFGKLRGGEVRQQLAIQVKGKRKSKGIPNIGNTCFMNAVIQLFCWTPNFSSQLKRATEETRDRSLISVPSKIQSWLSTPPVKWPVDQMRRIGVWLMFPRLFRVPPTRLDQSLLALVDAVQSESRVPSALPQAVIDSLTQIDEKFKGNRQQDSYEFFNKVVGELEDLCEKKSTIRVTGTDTEVLMRRSPVSRLFGGVFCNIYTYNTCDHVDLVFQRFTSIPVQIPEPSKNPNHESVGFGNNKKYPNTKHINKAANQADGSTEEKAADQAGGSTEEKAADQTVGSTEEKAADQTDGSTEERAADQTDGSTEEKAADQTDGSTVEKAADQTDGSTEEKAADQTDGSTEEKAADQTDGSTEEKAADQTDGSTEEKAADQTDGSKEEKAADQTDGSTEEKAADQTDGSTEEKAADQTDGSTEEKAADQTDGSTEEKAADQTDGSTEEKAADQTDGSTEERAADQTDGSTEEKAADQTEGSTEEKAADQADGSTEEKAADQTDGSTEEKATDQTDGSTEEKAADQADGSTEQRSVNKTDGSTEEPSINNGRNYQQQSCHRSLKHNLDGETDLERGLKLWFDVNKYDGLSCRKCVTKDPATDSWSRVLFVALPPVLVLQFNRFQMNFNDGSLKKMDRRVSFPEYLDAAPFCSSALAFLNDKHGPDTELDTMYRLYGVVCHSGSIHGGHYTAHVRTTGHQEQEMEARFLSNEWRDPESFANEILKFWKETDSENVVAPGSTKTTEDNWYTFNDTRVTQCTRETVLCEQNAYILMYERVLQH